MAMHELPRLVSLAEMVLSEAWDIGRDKAQPASLRVRALGLCLVMLGVLPVDEDTAALVLGPSAPDQDDAAG